MHTRFIASLGALATLCAAPGALAAGAPAYTLTTNPADVPGVVVDFGALPPNLSAFYDGTRIGASVESAREYNFMGSPIAMGYREAGADEIRNTYFPGVATALVFRFDAPVSGAGAFLRGVDTAGINASYGVDVTAYDEFGQVVAFGFVEFETDGGPTPEVFVGIVGAAPGIKEIEFAPPSIGGIGARALRPGGPAVALCEGDANGDRIIDFLDLNLVLSDFGVIAPGLAGDLDFDGDCDFVDLNIVLGAFGTSC